MIRNRQKEISLKALGIIKLANVKENPLEIAQAMQEFADNHNIDLKDIYLEFMTDSCIEHKNWQGITEDLVEKKCSMLIVPTLADISENGNELNKFMDDMDQKEVAIYEMLSDILWLPEKHYNDFMLLLMWLERDVYRY